MSDGYWADTQAGRVVAGEIDTVWRPRTPREGTCGVLLLHGQGNPLGWIDPGTPKPGMILAGALAASGIPLISAEMHGNSWATTQSMTDMRNAWNVLKTEYPLMRTDKVIVLGGSMGGAFAARWSQLYPSETAAVVGLIPAFDPKSGYIFSNIGDYAMEQAWGFSGLANFPADIDLASTSALAKGIPHFTVYSANDDALPAANIVAYHTAVGGLPENIVNQGNLLHSFNNTSDTAIARFLVANGA